jgi:HlyD family secretion protein
VSRRAALVVVAVLAAGAAARWLSLATHPRARVAPGVVDERVLARALVEAAGGVAEVRARTDGRVERVLVRVGDSVQAGDLLAELEEDALLTEVNRRAAEQRAAASAAEAVSEGARPEERAVSAAQVEAARRELALAEDRAAREAKLISTGSTSEASELEARRGLEIARARVDSLEAQLALARAGGRGSDARAAQARAAAATAALQLAKSDLSRTRVVAPTSGVVLERRIDPGDTIVGTATGGPPAPLFEIADVTRLELRVEVADRDAAELVVGQTVLVTPEGGGDVLARATLTRLGPRLEPRTLGLGSSRVRADERVRAAWATLDGAATRRLVIGQALEATVVLARRAVPARVPRAAVQLRDGRAVVDVVWGPLAREVPVTLRVADDAFVEVRGVAAGETVLLH